MKLVRGKTLSQAIKEYKNLDDRLKLLPHFVDLCNAIAYPTMSNGRRTPARIAKITCGTGKNWDDSVGGVSDCGC